MKVLGFPNPTGSAYWRLHDPFKYLQKLGIDAQVSDEGITEKAAEWADIYVLQSIVDWQGIGMLAEYQDKGKKIVVDCDDFLELADDNPHLIEHQNSHAPEIIKATLEIADMVTTTSNHLANYLKTFNENVVVLPNYMDMERWDLPKLKNTSETVRIGWAGSLTHLADLQMIIEPLKRICKEFPQIRLIFCGEVRIAEYLADCPVEQMLGVPFEVWPSRLHGLRLDIGLAPLRDTKFNRCKSNIKWQEYAISGVPGVYSPTVYQHRGFEPKFGLVAYDNEDWYQSLKHLIENPERRQEISEGAYRLAQIKYDLKRHANKWKEAYENLMLPIDPKSK